MSASKSSLLWGLAALAALSICSVPAQAGGVLTVAMTAADIPDDTGAPDQGYEGYRFVGYTLYDPLIMWDLSSSDKVANIIPGLATDWAVDPTNNTRWLFHLRKGVKFHDGCAFDADAVTWNFAVLMDPKAPQYNARHAAFEGTAVINIASVSKVDDYTVAVNTKGPDSLLPYDLAEFFMISPCAVKGDGYDYTKFAAAPSGTGPYKFSSNVPHQRLEMVPNADYWNPKPACPSTTSSCCCRCPRPRPAPRRCSPARWISSRRRRPTPSRSCNRPV